MFIKLFKGLLTLFELGRMFLRIDLTQLSLF